MGYSIDAVKGFWWLGSLKVLTKGFALVRIVLIARLLSPYDMGLFGIVVVVLALIEVLAETGVNIFFIQKKEHWEKFIDTSWVISIVRGILITGLVCALAVPVSRVYKEPSLLPFFLATALIPLVRGFINPSIIVFLKRLEYRKNTMLRLVIATVENLGMILFAFLTKSAIGLIYGLLFSAVVEMILSHLFISPKPRLHFRIEKAKEIFSFGKWLNISGIFSFLGNNLDDLIAGKVAGTAPLGYYQMAYNVTQAAGAEVGDVAAQTLYPIFSKIDDDPHRIKKAFFRFAVPFTMLILIPPIVLLSFPRELITLVLGEKWIPIIPALAWLCAQSVLQGINSIMYPVLYVRKKPHQYSLLVFINLVVLLACIFPLTQTYGFVGTAMALFFGRLAIQPLFWIFLFRSFDDQKRTART